MFPCVYSYLYETEADIREINQFLYLSSDDYLAVDQTVNFFGYIYPFLT